RCARRSRGTPPPPSGPGPSEGGRVGVRLGRSRWTSRRGPPWSVGGTGRPPAAPTARDAGPTGLCRSVVGPMPSVVPGGAGRGWAGGGGREGRGGPRNGWEGAAPRDSGGGGGGAGMRVRFGGPAGARGVGGGATPRLRQRGEHRWSRL